MRVLCFKLSRKLGQKLLPNEPTHFSNVIGRALVKLFFYMSAQEGGGGIRTSDLRFIRRGPSRLNYLLGTALVKLLCANQGLVLHPAANRSAPMHVCHFVRRFSMLEEALAEEPAAISILGSKYPHFSKCTQSNIN
jgi:hypothetical protein